MLEQARNGTYLGARVGTVKPHRTLEHFGGQAVLYRPSTYGEGTVTVERPMTRREIARQKANHSLLTTTCTMVNVPKHLVIPERGINVLLRLAMWQVKKRQKT